MKTLVGRRVTESGRATHYVFLREDMDFDVVETKKLSGYITGMFNCSNAAMREGKLVCLDTHLSMLPANLENTIHIVAEVYSNNIMIGYKALVSGNLELVDSGSVISGVIDRGYEAINFKVHRNSAGVVGIRPIKGSFRKLELVTKQ